MFRWLINNKTLIVSFFITLIALTSALTLTNLAQKDKSQLPGSLARQNPNTDIRAEINNISPTPSLIPSPTPTFIPTRIPLPTAEPANYINVYITYYGWNDNDPPSNIIAYPAHRSNTLHDVASGTGTYEDPITFASDPNVFAIGTKMYAPYIKKYIIMEDLCASCSGNHIDIWMQSAGSFESELYACQRHWTRQQIEVELNPPPNRSVEYTPLFNQSNGQCLW